MKISNETKVGIIGIVSITLLILGFNFLKGRNLFGEKMILYAKYNNIQGLTTSNPVIINGMQVGLVNEINNDKDMKTLLVTIELHQNINIPDNSIALIIPSPLGSSKMEIKLGDNKTFLKNGDSISTSASKGIVDDVLQKVDPVLYEIKNAVSSLDEFIKNANSIFDKNAKNNIAHIIENLNQLSSSLIVSGSSLEKMLDSKSGPISSTLKNVESVTGNLAKNNSKINSVIDNLDKTTHTLSQLDLQNIISSLNLTISSLNNVLSKLNSKDGSIGLLVNDQALYKNLTSTGNKLNLLLDDIRVHPKRYVSISMIGKNKKQAPLSTPLPDTLNSPYLKQ